MRDVIEHAPEDPDLGGEVEGPQARPAGERTRDDGGELDGDDVKLVNEDAGGDSGDGVDDEGVADQPWAWHAVRVSGLFLAGLITWQFVVTFVINDIGATTAATMTTRWRDSTWRTIEWVTLFLALAHGGLALVRAVNAAQWSPRVRQVGSVSVATLTLGLMGAVTVVALTLK